MAKVKFDGVVEAVHYKPGGEVDWARAYLRRGPIFSDRVKLDRQALVEQVKSGKRFVVGKRVERMGGTFETSSALRVLQKDSRELLVAGDVQADQDCLKGVPVL